MVALAAALLPACSSGSGATPAATAFLRDWSKFDLTAAGAATDNPATATLALQTWKSSLEVSRAIFKLASTGGAGNGRATAKFSADVVLNGLGSLRYQGTFPLRRVGSRWVVAWSPAVLYPGLAAGQELARSRTLFPRAPILDRNGTPLVTPAPVVTVGVVPSRLQNAPAALAVLQKTTGADPARPSPPPSPTTSCPSSPCAAPPSTR